MSEGAHAYHTGVDYKEHHGTEINLLFGQEMSYVIGSENTTIIGMESKLNFGAIADVGLVTKVELEFGAEVQWVSGWHFVMAGHGGGVFDGAFAVSAGSANLTSFKALKVFLSLVVAAQVIAAGVSAGLITTVMAPHKNASGDIEISGNSGFFALTTVNAQLLSLATLILTIALNSLLKKQAHITPISAMSINKQGYGFLGVSATIAGGAVSDGSSGLALSPQSFTLSFDSSQRAFEHQGHENVGFTTPGSSYIKGDSTGISVQSNSISIQAPPDTPPAVAGQPPVPPTQACGLDFAAGVRANLYHRNATSNGSVNVTPGNVAVTVADSVNGGGRLVLAPNSAQLQSSTAVGANAVLKLEGGTATLEGLNSSAQVELSATTARLAFGMSGGVVVSATGVDIASGGITVLLPTVPAPDVATITQLATQQAQAAATALKADAEAMIAALKANLEAGVKEKIAQVIRDVDTKIGQASVQAGAV